MSSNRLFVANKPSGVTSNRFLASIKRKYGVKKAGYSGTLDPFAKGALIVAFGQYTKLFRFLKKTPKRYRATLWLGASSPTLDIEKVEKVSQIMPFAPDSLDIIEKDMLGEHRYLPPKYSAKKIGGKRAYDLARAGEEFEMNALTSRVYDFKILHYCHPFLSFDITISEGGYVRSMGEIIAKRFGFDGALSALCRISEGDFVYDGEKKIQAFDFIDAQENSYLGDINDIKLGKKLKASDFSCSRDGRYKLKVEDTLSIIQIDGQEVEYLLNKVTLC